MARINGEPIQREDFLRAFNAYWREIIHLPIAQASRKDMEEFLIELVRGKIVEREAKKMGISVTSKELDEYIEKNVGSKNLSPVVIELLKVEVLTQKITDRIARHIRITDDQITAYYYLNLRDFKLPAQVLLSRYVAEDLDTANELYYRLSKGYLSVKDLRGVKVGPPMWYSIQTLPEIVKSQLYPYEEGKVTKPIQTEAGYLILRVVRRRGGGILPLEEAKPLVREKLLKEKRQEVFRKWLEEVLQSYRVEFFFSRL